MRRSELCSHLHDCHLHIEGAKLAEIQITQQVRGLWSAYDERNYALMSCQYAMPQGKFAGHNAVNVMFGKEPISYLQPQYATCLDLGPENALLTNGWERNVEMFGSEAKALKNQIVTQWIYPAGSVEETLKMSAPEVLAS